jgi:hypothetical protein
MLLTRQEAARIEDYSTLKVEVGACPKRGDAESK